MKAMLRTKLRPREENLRIVRMHGKNVMVIPSPSDLGPCLASIVGSVTSQIDTARRLRIEGRRESIYSHISGSWVGFQVRVVYLDPPLSTVMGLVGFARGRCHQVVRVEGVDSDFGDSAAINTDILPIIRVRLV